MFETVEIPVWAVWVAAILAGIAALDRIVGPGLRWFFRRRLERVIGRLNARLDRKIEPFKLMRRQDMVVRLLYDPAVLEAVADHAAATGVPGEVALEEARRYAREIVPAFSALFYFGFATRAARALSSVFFRVRVRVVADQIRTIDPRATVIFVMNHRSNMDYVLVTWLVSNRTAIAYAVGEWARVWPLSRLIRAMGAYFIRRGGHNALYRRVLSRYVQMITATGTTQAMFPEGGLSLNGRVGPPKMGLLSYIWAGFDANSRDVVFVPVGLAYDRVLEDGLLVRAAKGASQGASQGAGQKGARRFRAPLLRVLWESLRVALKRAGGRRFLFGTAAAGFGAPISLRAFQAGGGDLDALGQHLMAEVERVVPVLAAPLVAASLVTGQSPTDLVARLVAGGAVLKLPPGGVAQAATEGLAMLRLRGVVDAEGSVPPEMQDLLGFYAASVLQRLALPPADALSSAVRQT